MPAKMLACKRDILVIMLVIDIEASGTNPQKHSIVSLGAIDFSQPERQFYGECQIWDGAHVMDEALEVNGFTEAQITDPTKMTEAELVTQFLEWTQEMSDRTLTGQNVSFDRTMLQAAVERTGHMFDLPYRTLDTHTMCFMHMITRGLTPPHDAQHRRTALNLNAVLEYSGVPSEPDPHNALTGAMCHAEVASRLLYSKKLLPEFSSFEIPW
jgi:DNA polymerase III epsilon subunit-like protein